MNTKKQVLQACTINGTLIKLPDVQLDRKLYQEVAKSLELIGGKWKGGKVAGFIFNEDPTELLSHIANGETRNLKKEFQFFPTPPEIADWLVQLAEIKPEHHILEPSAGQGAIIWAILRNSPERIQIDYCELMPVNQAILFKIEQAFNVGGDFLTIHKAENLYDRIIANPPFSKNQDIDHIRKMYECLKPGGRLVSLASQHWHKSTNRKETEFREWLSEVKAEQYEIGPGAFKESGTMINTTAIVINKPPIITNSMIPKVNSKVKSVCSPNNRKSTVNHISVKDTIISDMEDIIIEATKNTIKRGEASTSIEQYLKIFQAKTPKQIAEKTADFIHDSDSALTGINSDGYIEFRYNKKSYKAKDAISLPGLLLNIKSGWGDGVTHNPSSGLIPENYGRKLRKGMQEDIQNKRNWVMANLCDPKERKSRDNWIEWLKACTDTNDIYYQCRNYILNPKSLAGVHITDNDQKVIFTPWSAENPNPHLKGYTPKPAPVPLPITENKTEPIQVPAPIPALLPERPTIPVSPNRPKPANPSQPLELVEYSSKAVALFGNSKHLKQQLIELHGAFCRHLKRNNQPTPGWVFSKKRETALRQLINI